MPTGRLPLAALVLATLLSSSIGWGGAAPRSAEPATADPGEAADPGPVVTLSDDAAWSWFPDPRAVCFGGNHDRTYVGWVDAGGRILAGSYDHDSGEIVVSVLADSLRGDDHSNPSMLILPDGRLMAFYSAHGGDAVWTRTTTRSEDVSAWGEENAVTEVRAFAGRKWGYTYPNAIRLVGEGGRIYVFYRGPDFKQWFVVSDDGLSWSEERPLMQGPGEKPYFKYASDGDATIHVAFTDGHPRGEEANSIYYMCYRGGAFLRADGSRIKRVSELPVHPEEADKVYDGLAAGARSWIWDVAADASGRPVVVYAAFPSPDDHRYRYARWDGEVWVDDEVVAGGPPFPDKQMRRRGPADRPLDHLSGGICLDHDDPSVVYLSRAVDGVHEIERWTTADGGGTWSSRPVTAGSDTDNVRPAVLRGRTLRAPEALWLTGSYDDYDVYDMAIRMLLPGQAQDPGTERRSE